MFLIEIDMKAQKATQKEAPKNLKFLGGRALISYILLHSLNPRCHPLGEENQIVIAPGLLTGTMAPCSGRLSIGAKSPLTNGIKESNVGGTVGQKLARMGIKGIVIRSCPRDEHWYNLLIKKGDYEFVIADVLRNKNTYETAEYLRERYGKHIGILMIGPVGEMEMPVAGVACTDINGNPSRYAARGGIGAVFGSKRLKSIIIDDSEIKRTKTFRYADRERFNDISGDWAKNLAKTRAAFTKFGTALLVNLINEMGGLPTRYYTLGRFEYAENISGEALYKLIREREGTVSHACSPGCVIRCSNIVRGPDKEYLTSGLEYETIAMFGSNLEISDLDAIASFDRKCDEYGIDTIEMANTIGVAMQAGLISFGDVSGVHSLIDEVKNGSLMGRVLGQGAVVTGRVHGVKRVAAVKGQGMSGYDPRAIKGTGVTFATSPMGADHTAGNVLPMRGGYHADIIEGEKDSTESGEKIRISRDLQIMVALCDSLGFCFFAGTNLKTMEIFTQLMNARFGSNYSVVDLIEMGKDIIKREIQFNREAGISVVNDVPEFFRTEKLQPKGFVFTFEREKLDRIFEAEDHELLTCTNSSQ